MSRQWIVVGAGSAGAVVAGELSEDPSNRVLLLEAGSDRSEASRPSGLRSLDWLSSWDVHDAWWDGPWATRQSSSEPTPYLRGRGVGGSSAVNGMLSLPGLPEDFDRWERVHGCRGWSWADVSSDLTELRRDLRRAMSGEQRHLDRVVARAVRDLGFPVGIDLWSSGDGVGPAWLSASRDERRASAELWLDPARPRTNLSVRGHAQVHRVILDGRRAAGVELTSGEVIEGDRVVLCAGAIGSPTILLRSGVARPGLGANLSSHPSLRLSMHMDDTPTTTLGPPIASIVRLSTTVGRGDLHLLPLTPTAEDGRVHVIAACMQTTSRGKISLSPRDPDSDVVVDLRELETEHDQAAMRDARVWLERLTATPAFARHRLDVGEVETSADLHHAAGTCRMGPVNDPGTVVDTNGRLHDLEGIHVADASILPELPSAGPHLTIVMVARRLARGLRTARP